MADIIDEVVTEVEAVVEETFKPKPGGLVDTYRKDKARREEASRERENADERVEETSYRAIKVTHISPEIFSVNVVTIPAGGNAAVLPLSKYRYRATLTVTTTGKTAILAKDAGAAITGVGYPLVNGATPLVLSARGQLYAFNSDVNPIQIAVIAELYAPET